MINLIIIESINLRIFFDIFHDILLLFYYITYSIYGNKKVCILFLHLETNLLKIREIRKLGDLL